MSDCPCACHGAYQGACSIESGCGSAGCDYDLGPSGHRCARGEFCKDREPVRDDGGRHTGEWLPKAIIAARGLCEVCTRDIVHALNHLAGDVVELTTLLGRINGISETFVSGTPDLLAPINLHIEALRTEIDDELQCWVEPVAEQLAIPWDTTAMNRSLMAVRVQRAASILSNAVDVLLALPEQEHLAWEYGERPWAPEFLPDRVQETRLRDGIEGAFALFDLHRKAWFVAGRTEYVQRIEMPCQRCHMRALVRRNGDDFVVCENCRERTPWEHIPFLCRVLIDSERALQEERRRGEERQVAAA